MRGPVAKRDRLQDVLRKQRNADAKVRRLEAKAIRIRNTKENPHKTPSEIRAMSPMQLAEHDARLTSFNRRENRYVQGVDNVPIPSTVEQTFNQVRDASNARVKALEESVKNLVLPGSDTTVATLLSNRKQLAEQGMRQGKRVLNPDNRDARNFKSPEAMRAAANDILNKNTDRYIRATTDKRLNSIRAALTYSGNVDLVDQLDELTWSQKLLLLDYSLFGNIAALNIDSGKYDSSGEIRDDYQGDDEPTQNEDLLRESLLEQLKWARRNGSKASVRGTGRRGRGGGRAN